jgi:Lrp/AsnC family leucine-responsive transcriptional regulator
MAASAIRIWPTASAYRPLPACAGYEPWRKLALSLAITLMALIHISMDRHTPARFANFEKKISELPEIMECLLITGQDADYQLKVVVRDMEAYQELLLNKITRIEGVSGVHSSFVMRRVVDKTALPVSSS